MEINTTLSQFNSLPEDEQAAFLKRKDVRQYLEEATAGLKFIPSPGKQTDAYFCEADVLLYGGSGGSGKSGLLVGLALTKHQRSLLIRKQYTDLTAIIDDAIKFNGTRDGFNGSPPPKLRTKDGRLIVFGACAHPGDEEHFQGQPNDFLGIDEASQLQESQVRFLMGWVRSIDPDQRCRVVLATNPPTTAEGLWLVSMFAPWLDETFPDSARYGDLRWVITNREGVDQWVDGPEPVECEGETYIPTSRTFIPAALRDNPFLSQTGYQKTLDALPEPLRSAIRDGKFTQAFKDDAWQTIPTAWIRAAQERWTAIAPDVPMTSIGVDVSQGGQDSNIIARRHGYWYDKLIEIPGSETPLGTDVSAPLITCRKDMAEIILDCGGGYGGSVFKHLKDNGINVTAYKGSQTSHLRSKDGQLRFKNKRAETYWKFREALDPSQSGGSKVCLPPDTVLMADLSAPRYETCTVKGKAGIQLETKVKVTERLGRSPDKGDAVVMAWTGQAPISYTPEHGGYKYKPKVITAYQSAKRKGVQYGKRH